MFKYFKIEMSKQQVTNLPKNNILYIILKISQTFLLCKQCLKA